MDPKFHCELRTRVSEEQSHLFLCLVQRHHSRAILPNPVHPPSPPAQALSIHNKGEYTQTVSKAQSTAVHSVLLSVCLRSTASTHNLPQLTGSRVSRHRPSIIIIMRWQVMQAAPTRCHGAGRGPLNTWLFSSLTALPKASSMSPV
jgi:hypothetical protein